MSLSLRSMHFTTSLVVLTVTVSACVPFKSQPQDEQPPPYDSVLQLHSAREALKSDYLAQNREGCPAFSQSARRTVFGDRYTFVHNTWNTQKSATLYCTLRFSDAPEETLREVATQPPILNVVILRAPNSNAHTAKHGYNLFGSVPPRLRRQEHSLNGQYPGFGAATEDMSVLWQCGPYRIKIWGATTYSVTKRVLAEDLLQVLEFHTKELCGTTDAPSQEVIDDPYADWAIYDAFGGTKPTEYNVPRPEGMTPGKPHQLFAKG